MSDWLAPVESIKGVGSATRDRLHALNIITVKDLLFHFPFRYENIKERDLETVMDNEKIVLKGRVVSDPVVHYYGARKNRLAFRFALNNEDVIQVVFFNQPYLAKTIQLGDTMALYGKWQAARQSLLGMKIIHNHNQNNFDPVYSSVKGLSQKQISNAVYQAFETYGASISEILPDYLNEKYRLLPLNQALYYLHFPTSQAVYHQAERKIIFQEFFVYQWMIKKQAQTLNLRQGVQINATGDKVHELKNELPFKMTPAQEQSLEEIMKDLQAPYPMRRILQGDVGSGKTIVAFLSMLFAIQEDYQAVLMVPTEILAQQHYDNFNELFNPLGYQATLLVSDLPQSEKNKRLQSITDGEANIIIGTHALIQDTVSYCNLGLVIIDEQHRFGVNQRQALVEKHSSELITNVLQMTATPIPRTMAQTVFQDMMISTINQMPAGRKTINTQWMTNHQIDSVYQIIRDEIQKGHQVYYVLPLINPSDALNEVENVQSVTERLQAIFPHYLVGFLHGQMDKDNQRDVMERFVNNQVNILVATTMVEVGVNVPNATVMVIQSAERFGLSQLHQLRGRVGRNNLVNYCLLIANPTTETGQKRLEIITQERDGFIISEQDMSIRGMGDVLGSAQSGIPQFNHANIVKDYHILKVASEEVNAIMNNMQRVSTEDINRLNASLENIEIKI